MRSIDEIVERARACKPMFGWDVEVLCDYLPGDRLRDALGDRLKETADTSAWQPKPYTAESVKADAVDYLRFAVGKAEDHRGISAGRSIEKMREYLWLLGDDALLGRFLDAPYPQYGAPQLKVLWDAWLPDEAINETVAVMATGNLCRDDCQGCGV